MSTEAYLKYENRLVTCPYDEVHKVKASRFQLHIAKCKLNHLDKPREACPFNASHLILKSELDFHLLNCPDKAPLDRKMAQNVDRNNPFRGHTAVPSYSEAPRLESDEVWDDEIGASGPGYIPRAPPPGAIIEPRPMSQPAERRSLYKDLRRMQNEPEKEKEILPLVKTPTTPRQPKEMSELQKQQQQKAIQNLGLGRGRPQRIAANIFDNTDESQTVVNNVTNGISSLGLGRAQASAQSVVALDDDDEFPALGCGRGAFRVPRQNPRAPGERPGNQSTNHRAW